MGPVHAGTPAGAGQDHGGEAAGGGHRAPGTTDVTGVTGGGEHGAHGGSGQQLPAPSGLAVAEGDLRLVVDQPVRVPAKRKILTLRILGADQRPVTDFDLEQGGVRLHLVVVGRDLSGFQHLHPSMAPDGTWSTPLTVVDPGVQRAFVDATVAGRSHTLATDLFVPGPFNPRPLALRFTVPREAAPVENLEPYLGTGGHLVGLRG